MRDIVVLGGGGHARVLIGILKRDQQWTILGYTDNHDRGRILGVEYLGEDSALAGVIASHRGCNALVGVGHVTTTLIRKRLMEYGRDLGFVFPPVVSIHAIVGEAVSSGEGTVIMDGALINTGSTLGRCCIVNSHSTVEHDCTVGDHVHICPGAVLSGGVSVGNDVLIGAGSCIVHGVNICDKSVIGAGSVVVGDIAEPGVYAGNPARRTGRGS